MLMKRRDFMKLSAGFGVAMTTLAPLSPVRAQTKSCFQGIRRSTPRLSNRGGDRESGQEAGGRDKWAALGPDVSVDATGRRERDHRTDEDRRRPLLPRQRRVVGAGLH